MPAILVCTKKMEKQIEYSIVVPVFNEEGNVERLFGEIKEVMEKIGKTYEIIFVDDGSGDATVSKLLNLKPIRVVRLRKNSQTIEDQDIRWFTMEGVSKGCKINFRLLVQGS